MLRYETRYLTPELCQAEPQTLFCFGDNLQRRGTGPKSGQAIIRGEPNAVGIPTKVAPANDAGAFFSDRDLPAFKTAAAPAFARLAAHLRAGGDVVWPAGGIGTGRARLRESAPRLWDSLERARLRLEAIEPEKVATWPAPERIEDHPFVRAVMLAWPGAEIVAVRNTKLLSAEASQIESD